MLDALREGLNVDTDKKTVDVELVRSYTSSGASYPAPPRLIQEEPKVWEERIISESTRHIAYGTHAGKATDEFLEVINGPQILGDFDVKKVVGGDSNWIRKTVTEITRNKERYDSVMAELKEIAAAKEARADDKGTMAR